MEKIQVLAIAVHPDDVELCCAGTLMMEKLRGKTTGVVDLTRGELGTRGTPELRLREAEKSARILNLDIRENLGLADGFFQNNEESQRKLIGAIRQYQPDFVLASALADRHPDHGRAGKLISDSCFLSGLRKYPHWIKTDWNRAPGAQNMFFISYRTGSTSLISCTM